MSTLATRLAGIFRIDFLDWNSRKLCLVGDKTFELKESPIAVPCPLRFPNRCRFANAFEILKGYRSAGVFSFLDDAFGDTVVRMLLKSFLLSRNAFKFSFASLSSLALKFIAKPLKSFSVTLNDLAGERFSSRIGSDVHHAKINSKKPINIFFGGVFDVASSKQVESRLRQYKIGFSTLMLKKFDLMFATNKMEFSNGH